jgi:hypothetical protein
MFLVVFLRETGQPGVLEQGYKLSVVTFVYYFAPMSVDAGTGSGGVGIVESVLA